MDSCTYSIIAWCQFIYIQFLKCPPSFPVHKLQLFTNKAHTVSVILKMITNLIHR